MRITARTSLARVATRVGDALRRAGIDAVLTGGACASIHSAGDYQSLDIDFVLRSTGPIAPLDTAMASLGFVRRGRRYEHPASAFFIEFLPAPVAIGADTDIRPVTLAIGGSRVIALSPTDAARDRLAAFYHWQDRASLAAAVAIGRRHRLDLARIRRWSEAEGAADGFETFRLALDGARRARQPAPRRRPRKPV
ncbi:MAG: hypothetical protein R2752_04200 [Vicinamibacterales bacterium]